MRKLNWIIIPLFLFIACEDEKATEDETPSIEYSNSRRATWTDGNAKASYEWSTDGKSVNVIDPDTKELLVRREYNDYGYRTLQVEKFWWGQTDSSVMTYDIWKPLSENRYTHNGDGQYELQYTDVYEWNGLKVKVTNSNWGLLREKEFDEAGREIFVKYYKFDGDPNYEVTSEYDINYQFRPLKVTRANYEDPSTLGSSYTLEETIWINKSATKTSYSDNGSGGLLGESFITVNEFDEWLTYIYKSNNVVQQSVTITYKSDRFKPYYTQ
tara:strand:- start:53 stop:862 length:810 start_codon:yes stop_codon:yes gene_type:complete